MNEEKKENDIDITKTCLPTAKTIPSKKIEGYHWLIYGQQKIGKSTFCSQFENPLFLPTEAGLKSLSIFKMPTNRDLITNWPEFIMICREIKKSIDSNTFKFNTIVIDTVDNLYQLCLEYVCKKHEMKHPSDQDFGKGWWLVMQEFKSVINKVLSWGPGVIFTSHEELKEKKTKKECINKISPSLSGAAGKYILATVDIIAYIGFSESDERIIKTRGTDYLDAGDRTGYLDPEMPVDYKKVVEIFNKKGANKNV